MGRDVIHVTASRSWWNGEITALCGASAQWGDYRSFLVKAPTCREYIRIKARGKR